MEAIRNRNSQSQSAGLLRTLAIGVLYTFTYQIAIFRQIFSD